MKKSIRNVLRVTALLVAFLFAPVPFLVSFASGLTLRRNWIAGVVGFVFTVAITAYSSSFPETFRFGGFDLRIHDGLYIAGFPSLVANVGKNLLFAYIGVLSGIAAREGCNRTRSNKARHPIPDRAVLSDRFP